MLFPEINSFPQLRVRTGFTFRDVYAHSDDLIKHLKDTGATTFGIVDSNTWGHVKLEKEAAKQGVQPIFGMEIPIVVYQDDGEPSPFKPKAWVLAKDLKGFYQFTTHSVQKGVDAYDLQSAEDVVLRFPGGALAHLGDECFDFIDINPSSFLLASQGVERHRLTGKPMVITSYNDLITMEDAEAAYSWEVRSSVGLRHIASLPEIWSALQHVMTSDEFLSAVQNTFAIAESLQGQKLNKAPVIKVDGDIEILCADGAIERLDKGHIKEFTQEYHDRLKMELEQIKLKGFDSYFIVVADLVKYAKQHMLVGPARGSAAGSLVCYVMGITEVDPIPHGLMFQRFIDVSRADFPDIDIDFDDHKRYMVFDYLKEKYGMEHVSKVGNVNTLQGRSVIAQVSKKFKIAQSESFSITNSMIEYWPGDPRYGHGLEDTFIESEPGRRFAEKNPGAARCMSAIEVHPSHTGVHAAGILVCNDPISHYCTVTAEGIAQIDKNDAEELNLLKIDVLGLRTLGIISDAGVMTADELYSLRYDDPKVLAILGDDKMSGIFQFEGQTVRACTRQINQDITFGFIDNLTSLARPGPLASGMAAQFIDRVNGKTKVSYAFPALEPILKDTRGIIIYQEQLMTILREIGGFDWPNTSAVRKGMAKSKGEEYLNQWKQPFIDGAMERGVTKEQAEKLWSEMATFGAYGFNKSHSVAYAIVTYWTAYLKCYHHLEFAAACLRTAKDDEQTVAILRELVAEGVEYTALDPEFSGTNWQVAGGKLVGGIMNAKGFGPAKALKFITLRENRHGDEKAEAAFQKAAATLAKAEVKFADLNETRTKWGHWMDNPRLAGIISGERLRDMASPPERGDCLFIAKMKEKKLLDEKSAERTKKRGGKAFKGDQSFFFDIKMTDDSVDTPMAVRVKPDKYNEFKHVYDNAEKGDWFLVRGWKIPNFDMYIVKKIKALDLKDSQTYVEE